MKIDLSKVPTYDLVEEYVTCWENRHNGKTGQGNPTTIEMATAVAAFGNILYPYRDHFVEDIESIRLHIRSLPPRTSRKEIDDWVRNNKEYYGIDQDGFCVDQSKVLKEKCFWCTRYLRGEKLCMDVDDNWKWYHQSWLVSETRTNRRGFHQNNMV